MPKKSKKAAKKQRAPRGEGSIFPNKRRGGWTGKVPVGRYPSGHTKYATVWGATHAECVAEKKKVKPPGPDTTVAEWADRWLRESGAQPATLADYTLTVEKHVKPVIGPNRVADLTVGDVENMVRGWRLGPNTARKNLRHVVTMLAAARRAKLAAENVAADARGPKSRKTKIVIFSPAELVRIARAAAEKPTDTIFAPLAAVGCRIGEAMALDVGDFDPAAATLSITKTYSRKHGLRRTKSENGIRTVRVPAVAVPAIRAAVGTRKSGSLFTIEGGTTRREHNAVLKSWAKFLGRLGLAYRNPHQLRHSVATHAIAKKVHIANVARDLGDSVAVIVNTYCHATDGPGVYDAMEGLFSEVKSGAKGDDKATAQKLTRAKR